MRPRFAVALAVTLVACATGAPQPAPQATASSAPAASSAPLAKTIDVGSVVTRDASADASVAITSAPDASAPDASALDAATATAAAPEGMLLVPAGTFTMGSPKSERDRSPNETQHPARVAAFAIGTHEVTVKQWKTVMGSSPSDCEYGCADEHPISGVSWNDACHFMIALTRRENEALRRRGA